MSQSRLKRPAQARERLRLGAALGALAAMAIVTGAVASLTAGTPVLSPTPAASSSRSVLDWIPNIQLSPDTQIEGELDTAQRALDRARELLDQAQRDGSLSPEELAPLERRLESFGPHELGPQQPAPDQRVLPARQHHRQLRPPPREL